MSGGIVQWESRDLDIPLSLSVMHWRHPDYVGVAAPRVQPFIQAALLLAAREGWRADEPTDFSTLFSRSRVRTTNSFIRWHVGMVTIGLVRPVRG